MIPEYLSSKKDNYPFNKLEKVEWKLTNNELTVECNDGYLDLNNFIGDKDKNILSKFGGYLNNKIVVKISKKDIKKGSHLYLYQKNGDKIVGQSEVFIY